jgi:multidrug efflux system membrane fusion protein
MIAAALAVFAIGLVLWWHPWGGQRRGPPTIPPQAIRDAAVTLADVPLMVNALGTVTPLATVTVQSQISGQLIEVGFTEGQEVKKGDFLAQIDPRPYQIALQQAQGTLAHDQALLQDARIDLARYQKLNRQDSIAQQQVDTQLYLVHQYEGTVTSDAAAVDNQKLNLVYCHITAPVDGRVGLRLVDPGNFVQTSSTTGLLVITTIKPITVIFSVPEDDIPQIAKRMATGASLPVTASNRADTSTIATGVLSTIDNQIDTTTGTVKLRASFPNTDEALFPNQFVNVALLVDTLHNAVVVPTPAIQRGAPGTFVYLVNANNTVSVKPIKIGPDTGTVTAVTSGLAVGDKVVIDGADRLRDGARIMIPAATPAAPASPTAAAPPHRQRPTQ